jgi:hypothetical protein
MIIFDNFYCNANFRNKIPIEILPKSVIAPKSPSSPEFRSYSLAASAALLLRHNIIIIID